MARSPNRPMVDNFSRVFLVYILSSSLLAVFQLLKLHHTNLHCVCRLVVRREYDIDKPDPDQGSREADVDLLESYETGRRDDGVHRDALPSDCGGPGHQTIDAGAESDQEDLVTGRTQINQRRL